ncbi:hypothetical protein EIP91_006096 [Steccherinum ochraceum]|uniref:Uncharacterized protein n=1 Tax=Steccherinum ochraceum TaxID=92696 RepID=A0A4R0RL01_9APHY|nr:hypothetical protein EIP91_006096 [Steccherinum ochraceum]
MHFATVLGSLLAVAASSVLAVPLQSSHWHARRELDANAMVARNLDLVVRDHVLRAVHQPEHAHIDAGAIRSPSPVKRHERTEEPDLPKKKWPDPEDEAISNTQYHNDNDRLAYADRQGQSVHQAYLQRLTQLRQNLQPQPHSQASQPSQASQNSQPSASSNGST